jgi:aminoglycoside/choline kinase family phosphotransferase
MIEYLKNLFVQRFSCQPLIVEKLPQSGSYRQYFRLSNNEISAIGVYNEDKKENKAFVFFCKHFFKEGIAVPELYLADLDNDVYLQEDLGSECLLDFIEKDNKLYSADLINLYKKVIHNLAGMQINGGKGLDYSLCVPRDTFDRQSIMWDLNYYKYCWCRLAKQPLDEQKMENDFSKLTDYLLSERHDFFLFRDFQSRNIMIKDGQSFFIDFQGGRKGALQYDIASLLYDAIAEIPEKLREDLLDYYMDCVEEYMKIDRKVFRSKYYAYALLRLMQAMGAFGLRGLHENKQHFIDSINPGMCNLKALIGNLRRDIDLPEIFKTIDDYKIL